MSSSQRGSMRASKTAVKPPVDIAAVTESGTKEPDEGKRTKQDR